MKLTAERLPESRVRLEIVADEDEFAKAMDRAYRKVSGRITLPGFRPGKAPRAMIERVYGRGVFLEEAGQDLMNDLYRRALKQEELVPVGDPEVEIVEAEPLAFNVTIPVYPSVDPASYIDIRVEPIDVALDATAVDAAIERLRKEHSPWVDPASEGLTVGVDKILTAKTRLPREGDQVTIDYRVMEAGVDKAEEETDADFVLGESGLIDQLESAIKHLRLGESTSFDTTFASDDESVDEELRGKTLNYQVTLKGLKERELLPLDDDFAKTVSDFETLEELRAQIANDLHQQRTAEGRAEVMSAIVSAAMERATIDIPTVMVDSALEEDIRRLSGDLIGRGLSLEGYLRLTNQTQEEFRDRQREESENRLRRSLLLGEIAKRESIAIEHADIEAEIDRLAAVRGISPDHDPVQARKMWDHEFVRNLIQERLLNERLSARLIGIATGGRDAVINGWVAPPPRLTEEADAGENSDDSPIASAADTKGEVHGAAGTSEEIELTNDDASAEPLSAGAAPADTAG